MLPVVISTCCHSALAARAATGAPTVTAVTLCVVRKFLCVPFRATGLELDRAEVIETLLTLQGVFLYARIFLAPTQSLAKVRTSLCAVRASRMNDLAVTVSIPRVQQAIMALEAIDRSRGRGAAPVFRSCWALTLYSPEATFR